MSSVKITGNASGTGVFTLSSPNSNTDRALTLPDGAGEIVLTDGTSLVVDNANDRVGIGRAPATTLDVNGTVTVTGTAGRGLTIASAVTSSGQQNADVIFDAADTEGGGTGSLRFAVGGNETMRTTSTSLLVGTTSSNPAKILATRGDAGQTIFAESTSSATTGIQAFVSSMPSGTNNTNCAHLKSTTQGVGSFHLYGNGSSSFSSDERLKKNIETTRDGYLADLDALRVVKYNWKVDEDSTPKELGLIAQEVQKVFPSVVVQDNEELAGMTDTLSVKHSVLPIITIKAVQELKAELDAEKAKTATLQTQMADLIARVAALEAK
jgi:hypothetical protein